MNPVLSGLLWVALTGAGLVVSFLPRPFELWLGARLGRLLLKLDWKRRPIAYDNIRRCLPELGEAGWRGLLRENYGHYGILALEMLHMFSPIPGHYLAYALKNAVVDNLEVWKRAHDKGKGTILVTGHLANWELLGIASNRGVPCLMATRPLKPEWLNRKVEAARLSFGTGATAYQKRILPLLIRQLKAGKTVGFVLDQYAPPPMGVPAAFFGVKVDTQGAIGLLAQRTGAAIVPVLQRRDAKGVVHVVFEPELELSQEVLKDPVKSTEALAARVEAWIRATPSQWLWVHRRFKNVVWPEETPSPAANPR